MASTSSRASHNDTRILHNPVADMYPDLHKKHLEAGKKAAAYRDAKEKKMPNENTFHNASTHYKGHADKLYNGGKLTGSDAVAESKFVDDEHLGKQGRR